MKFSLVIPCYNEAKNIPHLLEKCNPLILKEDIEIILVDNGSTDETAQVINNIIKDHPSCRYIYVKKNEGYGNGILAGLDVARGEILGWTHADLQTDPSDVLLGLDFFKKHGNDVFCKGRRYGRPKLDIFFTFGMSIFVSILMKKKLWDINAQPTMFSKIFFRSWHEPPKDFSLDLFAYYMAKKMKLRVYRFPVFFGNRAFGKSNWNTGLKSRINFTLRTMSYSIKLMQRMNNK